MRKIVLFCTLLSSISLSTFANDYWINGSYDFSNPSKSGVKKGDRINFAISERTHLLAIGGLCDFDKTVTVINTPNYYDVYCVYNGLTGKTHTLSVETKDYQKEK